MGMNAQVKNRFELSLFSLFVFNIKSAANYNSCCLAVQSASNFRLVPTVHNCFEISLFSLSVFSERFRDVMDCCTQIAVVSHKNVKV